MPRVTVIAPHADDETLGCGATLWRHKMAGDTLQWVICTKPQSSQYSAAQVRQFEQQIQHVADYYEIEPVRLTYPPCSLGDFCFNTLLSDLTHILLEFRPQTLYIPSLLDYHSDHRTVHRAAISATKRQWWIEQILEMEIPSETPPSFEPNYFVRTAPILGYGTDYLEKKLEIYRLYASEVQQGCMPRSQYAVHALAEWRGSQIGSPSAEAFRLIRSIAP